MLAARGQLVRSQRRFPEDPGVCRARSEGAGAPARAARGRDRGHDGGPRAREPRRAGRFRRRGDRRACESRGRRAARRARPPNVGRARRAPAGRVVLDAADGAAIVVLANPAGALRLAERALKASAAGLPLCAGINHGAVRVLGSGMGEAMVGDGIAVAASIAQFAPASEVRATRAFRDALADAAPGQEASLVPKGASSDASLRSHELFTRDRAELQRRARTYRALSTAAVVVLLASGIGWRVSQQGKDAFFDGLAAKYRATTAQGERYVRGLVDKAKFQ